MTQLAGWRFLELGRRIERAIATCRFVAPVRRSPSSTGGARRAARTRRQPDHLPAALRHGGGARAGARSRGARSQQSALGRLSARAASRSISRRCRSAATTAACRRREQIATSLATAVAHRRCRRRSTGDVDRRIEGALMKLVGRDRRPPISRHTSAPRRDWEALGMIYDVRQTTIYHYASPVAYARHVLRLTPIDRTGQRVHAAALDIDPRPDRAARRPRFLRQPHDLDRARSSRTRP